MTKPIIIFIEWTNPCNLRVSSIGQNVIKNKQVVSGSSINEAFDRLFSELNAIEGIKIFDYRELPLFMKDDPDYAYYRVAARIVSEHSEAYTLLIGPGLTMMDPAVVTTSTICDHEEKVSLPEILAQLDYIKQENPFSNVDGYHSFIVDTLKPEFWSKNWNH